MLIEGEVRKENNNRCEKWEGDKLPRKKNGIILYSELKEKQGEFSGCLSIDEINIDRKLEGILLFRPIKNISQSAILLVDSNILLEQEEKQGLSQLQ